MRSPAYGATNILLGSVRQRSSIGTEWSVPSTDSLGRPLLPTARHLRVAPGMRRHASIIAGLLIAVPCGQRKSWPGLTSKCSSREESRKDNDPVTMRYCP
jgi:hypothetical protein